MQPGDLAVWTGNSNSLGPYLIVLLIDRLSDDGNKYHGIILDCPKDHSKEGKKIAGPIKNIEFLRSPSNKIVARNLLLKR